MSKSSVPCSRSVGVGIPSPRYTTTGLPTSCRMSRSAEFREDSILSQRIITNPLIDEAHPRWPCSRLIGHLHSLRIAGYPPRIVGKHSRNSRLHHIPARTRSCSGLFKVQSVDFLGTDVTHEQGRSVRREAAPGDPRRDDAPQSSEAGNTL